jgi:hypothetical protein
LDRDFVFHQIRVRSVDHDVIGHAFDFGAGDRDFAVILSGNHQAVDPVDGSIAGDDSDFEIDGAELIGSGFGIGA